MYHHEEDGGSIAMERKAGRRTFRVYGWGRLFLACLATSVAVALFGQYFWAVASLVLLAPVLAIRVTVTPAGVSVFNFTMRRFAWSEVRAIEIRDAGRGVQVWIVPVEGSPVMCVALQAGRKTGMEHLHIVECHEVICSYRQCHVPPDMA
jgi:hypothetical protein